MNRLSKQLSASTRTSVFSMLCKKQPYVLQSAMLTVHQVRHTSQKKPYEIPPTFGEEHDLIKGGHIPDSWAHIHMLQDLLTSIHDNVGMPWWLTIASTTVLFRLLVLPLNISLIRNSARLNSIRHDLEDQGAIMQNASSTDKEKMAAAETYQNMLKEHNCHPWFNIASPFIMAPMFLSIFLSIERICLHDPMARGEGLLWFPDLSLTDPTWVLPALSGLTWLLTIEMGADYPRTIRMQQLRSMLRVLACMMVPITGALPSGVFVYWITSNVFSICQIYLLGFPAVRKLLNMPERHKYPEISI